MSISELVEMRRAIRAQVCAQCHRRPAGSEMLGSEVVRSCESTCDVFDRLPRLLAMVRRFGGEPPCGYHVAVQSLLNCASGDRPACASDQSPLARYATEVLTTLESLDHSGRDSN